MTYLCAGPIPVDIAIATNEKQFLNDMKLFGIDEHDGWCGFAGKTHRFARKNGCLVVVAVNCEEAKEAELEEVVGICAHEATHAHQYIAEYIGEDDPGAELEAYTIGWITQALFAEVQHELKQMSA
jgi:hypothetical protein